jgi:hypothetical protein
MSTVMSKRVLFTTGAITAGLGASALALFPQRASADTPFSRRLEEWCSYRLIDGAALITHNRRHRLSRVTASGNGVGIFANGAGVSLTIADTVTGNKSYGIGANTAAVMVRNTTINSNGIGIAADQTSIVRVAQATITANGTGWQAINGAQVVSTGNNNVSGNGTDGTPTSNVALE